MAKTMQRLSEEDYQRAAQLAHSSTVALIKEVATMFYPDVANAETIDVGSIIQGVYAGIFEALVRQGVPDATIRKDFDYMVKHILPQMRLGVAAEQRAAQGRPN